MKKILAIMTAITMAATITACNTETSPSPEVSPEASAEASAEATDAEVREPLFKLTETQETLYADYTEKNDIDVLEGADPVDIAKIFVQCGIDGNVEAEYNLYAPETTGDVSKSEYLAMVPDPQEVIQGFADINFSKMDEGVFTDNKDGTGDLKFDTLAGEVWHMKMIQNKDGIWLVSFKPFTVE